ncbi:MAG TPA: 50S ribosomal protein L13 [Crocinitomicaceae bacterium]|nr:50S ribosomal protein L13 [Crocinitomicaceae bacterium]
MDTLSYKTKSANTATSGKKWVLVDAKDLRVGRLASEVASIIRGKRKPNYTPHADCGDNVIIINAEKAVFTGSKLSDKQYVRYTGYPGGQKSLTAQEVLEKRPERVLEKAIKGMLPKNTLGRQLYRNLRVYAGAEHNQEAQKPEVITLNIKN